VELSKKNETCLPQARSSVRDLIFFKITSKTLNETATHSAKAEFQTAISKFL